MNNTDTYNNKYVQLSKDNHDIDDANKHVSLNATDTAKRLSLSKQIQELSEMNRKIEHQNASYKQVKKENEMISPRKQNMYGFETFDAVNNDFNKKTSRENELETNRTTDSLDVFPTN